MVVPCYAIDLMWHTHQLFPQYYSVDTTKILGKVLPHDDSINDRTPGGLLDRSGEKTKEIWKKTFNEEFFFPGGMYRGKAPSPDIYSSNDSIGEGVITKWLLTYGMKSIVILSNDEARHNDGLFEINGIKII